MRRLEQSELPSCLLEIPDPPKNLWMIGELPSSKQECVYLTVVGSRKNSIYGREACEKIIKGLKGYPVVIVSGFALGIDTIAHKTALSVGLQTVVFPGSGLSNEVLYPKANIKMINEITEGGGCLLSEYEPEERATIWSFPRRNRLMAGMSKATLVIEATEMSGTLITARLALEYNRDLLAVPGSIFLGNCVGSNRLIKEGAVSISSSRELLTALGFEVVNVGEMDKKAFQNILNDLSPLERRIINLLSEPIEKDALVKKCGLSIAEINVMLTVLELKSLIKEEYGKFRIV